MHSTFEGKHTVELYMMEAILKSLERLHSDWSEIW